MQKKKDIFIVLIISVLLISLIFGISSCRTKDKITQLSGNWSVIMIDDTSLNPKDFIKGLPVVTFDAAKKMISGYTGCNDFTGDATYAENTIEVGELIATKIACPDMEVEKRLLEILNNQIINFSFEGNTLILTNKSDSKLTLIIDTTETVNLNGTSTPEESTSTETDDIESVKTLVEDFGKVLKNVSLLSPAEILENDMKKYYSPFVSEELILQWIKDSSMALGRLTSSPWPEYIEIIDVKKVNTDEYEVSGNVVEITSVEVEQGGYADKYEINLIVERVNGKWFITKVIKETDSDNESSANQAAIMSDFDGLLADKT